MCHISRSRTAIISFPGSPGKNLAVSLSLTELCVFPGQTPTVRGLPTSTERLQVTLHPGWSHHGLRVGKESGLQGGTGSVCIPKRWVDAGKKNRDVCRGLEEIIKLLLALTSRLEDLLRGMA